MKYSERLRKFNQEWHPNSLALIWFAVGFSCGFFVCVLIAICIHEML